VILPYLKFICNVKSGLIKVMASLEGDNLVVYYLNASEILEVAFGFRGLIRGGQLSNLQR
jgi:hypothetical protein